MSMSDHELLELAAKAAGYDAMRTISGRIVVEFKKWNPLEDDGDALRLAITLNMTICTHGMGVYASDGYHMASNPECTDKDRARAVRRCIVRVAAEIGKSMQEQAK